MPDCVALFGDSSASSFLSSTNADSPIMNDKVFSGLKFGKSSRNRRNIDCVGDQRYISGSDCEDCESRTDYSENSDNGLNPRPTFVDIPTRGSVAKWLRQRIANPSSSVRLRPEPLDVTSCKVVILQEVFLHKPVDFALTLHFGALGWVF